MDWPNLFLMFGGAAALLWVVVAAAFPVFGGPWISSREYGELVIKVAAIVFAVVGLVPYGIVMAFRFVVGVLRWLVCEC